VCVVDCFEVPDVRGSFTVYGQSEKHSIRSTPYVITDNSFSHGLRSLNAVHVRQPSTGQPILGFCLLWRKQQSTVLPAVLKYCHQRCTTEAGLLASEGAAVCGEGWRSLAMSFTCLRLCSHTAREAFFPPSELKELLARRLFKTVT
jgi:hypothetical protein